MYGIRLAIQTTFREGGRWLRNARNGPKEKRKKL